MQTAVLSPTGILGVSLKYTSSNYKGTELKPSCYLHFHVIFISMKGK